ncbi:MAG: oligosaccharide flippase family protein [Clostridia bacterium]|nr:oligosaccharide flippase family protein [Clostridia bacterium]
MKRLKVFIINVIILTIVSLIVRSCGMLFDIYIANIIGSEGVGMFSLVMSVYVLFITLATSGINLATTRLVSEELAINDTTSAKLAIKKCIKLSLLFSVIVSFLLIVFAPIIIKLFLHNRISNNILYILAISLPFTSISISLSGYFTAVRRAYKASSSDVVNLVTKIITILALIPKFDLKNINDVVLLLILGTTISEIISFIYIYLLYACDKRRLKDFRTSKSNMPKRILKISIPVAITSYIRSGLSTLKQLLIPLNLEKSGLSCSYALSEYGMINGMSFSVLLFPGLIINSVASLLIPEFARYNVKQDYTKMNIVINKLFTLVICFSLFVLGFFLMFSKEISLIAYNNLKIGNYILILSPLVILMYLDHIIDAILRGIDKQVKVMYCNIADLFISVILICLLIPKYGIIGYLLIIYTSEILNTSISIYQLYKATHFKFDIFKGFIIPAMLLAIFIIIASLIL